MQNCALSVKGSTFVQYLDNLRNGVCMTLGSIAFFVVKLLTDSYKNELK